MDFSRFGDKFYEMSKLQNIQTEFMQHRIKSTILSNLGIISKEKQAFFFFSFLAQSPSGQRVPKFNASLHQKSHKELYFVLILESVKNKHEEGNFIYMYISETENPF